MNAEEESFIVSNLEAENANQPVEAFAAQEMVSFDLLCRICANRSDQLIPIHSEDGVGSELSYKINLYLPVKVATNDLLPQNCCIQCASTLMSWHDLMLTCIEADKRLRDLIEAGKQMQLYSTEVQEDTVIIKEVSLSPSLNQPSPEPEVKNENSDLEEAVGDDDEDGTWSGVVTESEEMRESPAPELACSKCSRPFQRSSDLTRHLKTCSPPDKKKAKGGDWKSHRCKSCEFVALSREKLREHVDGVHPETVKKYRPRNQMDKAALDRAKVVVDKRTYYHCDVCGKNLHSPYTYVWHIRIHTGERPFVCDTCGKQFRVSQGLVRHVRETHDGIKNFPCDICGRCFATKRNVEEHRRIHTNERPYVCDSCGKAFKQKASLFVHNRSHTDHFPFRCSYCGQGFRTRPPLLVHVTRHTGEKPHGCDVCGRRFRIKYELKRHRLIHSDDKPFSCDDCGISFRQKRYLRNHNKVNHPDLPQATDH